MHACAETLYALKVLWSQGMSADSLAVILKSVVLAKILYASPAWWGFANSSDKERLEAFLRRCTRLQLYRQCDPTVNQLVEDMEDKLLTSVVNNDKHVLSHILPDPNNLTYNLRPRRHELTLAIKGDARNFWKTAIQRHILIATISYFVLHFLFTVLCCFCFYCAAAFWQRILHIELNWIELNWIAMALLCWSRLAISVK